MRYCEACDIVHDEKWCPLCRANDRILQLEQQEDKFTKIIAELEKEKEE